MKRKAQSVLGISFGALISIMLIILILVVAIYAINHFLKLQQCTQVGSFYQDLEDEIIKAWPSTGTYRGEYVGNIPKGGLLRTDVNVVCFGNLTIGAESLSEKFQQDFETEYFAPKDHNIFIDPPASACGGDFFSYKLTCQGSNCLNVDRFFCVSVPQNGDVPVFIEKTTRDSQVTISRV